jgi:hypothetical protein
VAEVSQPIMVGHESRTRSKTYPVRCLPRDGSDATWVTVAYAVDRLKGYYKDDPPGWIQETLLGGYPLHTITFIYQYEEHK